MTEERSTPFTIIRGGLSETSQTSQKAFVSAYVTDTRLMGVTGVYIHWALPENTVLTHFHQFFYLDSEEYGFDTYKGVLTGEDGEGLEELHDVENALLGGLGGKQVNLSEKEAVYMVQEYAALNQRSGLELPGGYEEYAFLLQPQVIMDRTEEYVLMSKQCPILTSPYQVINYFLMRCFGKDFGAAKFLTKHYVRTNLFPEHKMATLFKNTIDPAPDPDSGSNTGYHCTDSDRDFGTFQTHTSYLCESLIEYDQEFYLVVTQVTLDSLRVVRFEKVSSFRISAAEAVMMLTRPEYITVFDWYEDAPAFTRNSTQLTQRAMITPHESGSLFMIFHPHNNHVNKQVYLLNDDVLGNYYVSDSGQLLLTSYTQEGIRAMEADFIASGLCSYAALAGKYQFGEPVLEEFMSSGFEDFTDFAAFIAKDMYDGED
ncbi:MAG: hypothetical protein ACI4LQ_09570 [Anaerovoracaceae bacterium]